MAAVDYKKKGLLPKYGLNRTDGQPEDPGAKFFVLRYDKNDAWGVKCRAALRSFAASIKDEYPKLADELIADVCAAEKNCCG